jgi:hypothetical protein
MGGTYKNWFQRPPNPRRLLQELTPPPHPSIGGGGGFSNAGGWLSADPLTVAEPEIANITARMTMVGGRIVHETQNRSG